MVTNQYTILIPSIRPHLAKEVEQSLYPLPVTHWDGAGYPSFSKLINDCIVACPTEQVVICSDKVRPNPGHIDRMMALLGEGYAFVGLYYFACFAFPKELVRRIGYFDERFSGGGYEDSDYMMRMREADVAYFMSKEVPYHWMATTWNYELSRPHYLRKWSSIHMHEAVRVMPEERPVGNELGQTQPVRVLPFAASIERR